MQKPILEYEKELLVKLRNGDVIAFEIIYAKYKVKLASNLFSILKSWEEVEETLQNLFLKLWTNRTEIDIEKPFHAYLNRIAFNLTQDYFRKIARDKVLFQNLWMKINENMNPDVLRDQVASDQELMRTIDSLPEQRKQVFKLCRLEGKSYDEVSRILSISVSTVNDHITKANKYIYSHYDRSITLAVILYCSILLK